MIMEDNVTFQIDNSPADALFSAGLLPKRWILTEYAEESIAKLSHVFRTVFHAGAVPLCQYVYESATSAYVEVMLFLSD